MTFELGGSYTPEEVGCINIAVGLKNTLKLLVKSP